jgi:excisionase family DNA binding protein
LSVEEAGDVLGLSRASSYGAVSRGEIPTIRIGRRLLVPTARLRTLLGENEGAVTPSLNLPAMLATSPSTSTEMAPLEAETMK